MVAVSFVLEFLCLWSVLLLYVSRFIRSFGSFCNVASRASVAPFSLFLPLFPPGYPCSQSGYLKEVLRSVACSGGLVAVTMKDIAVASLQEKVLFLTVALQDSSDGWIFLE